MNLGGSHISLASRPLGNVRVGPDPVGHVAIPFAVPEQVLGSSAPTVWIDSRAVDATPGTVKRDRSGNGNDLTHLVAGGGGLAITATSTGALALTFTGNSAERLGTPSIDLTGTPRCTVAYVFESSALAVEIIAEFSANNNLNTDAFVHSYTATRLLSLSMFKGAAQYNTSRTVSAYGTPQTVFCVRMDRTELTDQSTHWADGAPVAVTRPATAQVAGNFGNHALYIGDRAGGAAPLTAKVAQLLVWDRYVSDAELQAIWPALKSIAG